MVHPALKHYPRGPRSVVYLQALDGIGAGIYGVVVIALAADITCGRGHFNTLAGLFATSLAIGGVVGPLVSGFLVEHVGFRYTFLIFCALALVGATVFTITVPETKIAPADQPPNSALAA